MKPRVDVFSVSIDMPFDKLKNDIRVMGYSRIPVYKGKIDNIIGLIYLKDIFPHINKNTFDWKKINQRTLFCS